MSQRWRSTWQSKHVKQLRNSLYHQLVLVSQQSVFLLHQLEPLLHRSGVLVGRLVCEKQCTSAQIGNLARVGGTLCTQSDPDF